MPLRHLRQFISCDDSFDDSAMDVEHAADASEDGKNQHDFQYLFYVRPPVFVAFSAVATLNPVMIFN